MKAFISSLVILCFFNSVYLSTQIPCGEPGIPDNGDHSLFEVSSNHYLFGEEVQYYCEPGFILFGDQKRECNQSGNWDKKVPHCLKSLNDRPLICGTPDTPSNGYFIIEKWFAFFECFKNYKLSGVKKMICSSEGDWNASTPLCLKENSQVKNETNIERNNTTNSTSKNETENYDNVSNETNIETNMETNNETNVESNSETNIESNNTTNSTKIHKQDDTEDSFKMNITLMVLIFISVLLISVIVANLIQYLKTVVFKCNKYSPNITHNFGKDSKNEEFYINVEQICYENIPHNLLSLNGTVDTQRFKVDEEIIPFLKKEDKLIDRSDVKLEEVIGEGQFGCVYKGILYSSENQLEKEVAIKTLRRTIIPDEKDIELFIKEGLMMKDFKHDNVLTLIGISFEENGMPFVILPFMKNGDLLSYVRDEENMPTIKTLLKFAFEIAKGMEYLSRQKFVHRDLAARNCMLDYDLCAKVADFGLSRDIYETDYYSSDNRKCKLPVKWMPPESLEKGTYTSKTDVWSYGVMVWELMTRGITPYPEVDNWEILKYLKQGRRMDRPSYCPQLLYSILLECWSDDPNSRPTFAQLCNEVESVITVLEKDSEKQEIGHNVTYVTVCPRFC